jgi:hypothetical protein
MPQSVIDIILNQVNNLSPDERQALIAALAAEDAGTTVERRNAYGKYAGLLTPVPEFLRAKHQATDHEDIGPAA